MGQPLHPVVIGVGQCTYRDTDATRTPIDALVDSARLAIADTGCDGLLQSIDCLVTIPFLARQIPELGTMFPTTAGSGVAEALGIEPDVLLTSDFGGNLPQWFVNRCADDLVRGEVNAVLLSGCELMATLFAGLRSGADLSSWQQGGTRESRDLGLGRAPCLPAERAHGLFEPINTYPLFESALRHAYGWSEREQAARLGGLVSRMSRVAASNPMAWKRDLLSAEAVLSTEAGNRMITSPYTRAMNAILAVDMSASVILTTDAHARSLGVPPERMVYLQAGAEANDVWHTSERVDFYRSPALSGCFSQVLDMAGISVGDIDLFDLYSCFPSAVEVACDALGIAPDDPRGVTITGGLMRFGGPGNNYSLHAIAGMVELLRDARGRRGLVSANGGYLTKHAVGIYGLSAPAVPWLERDRDSVQRSVDALTHPSINAHPDGGRLVVEAHAVPFKDGKPSHGIVVGRLDDGRRCLAHALDEAARDTLLHNDCVGREGRVVPDDPVNRFSFD